MLVYVNGVETETPDGTSVAELVASMKLDPKRSVVERNLEIVPKDKWSKAMLKTGDRLEIVALVGGG